MNIFENEALAYNVSAPFNDVEGHWAASTIAYVEEQKWMIGVGDDQFNPDGLV